MTIRRLALAAAVLALLLGLYLSRSRRELAPGSVTPDENSTVVAGAPPPASSFPAPEAAFPSAVPASAATAPAKRDERPPLAVGRLVDEAGEPLAGYDVCVGGEALVRFLIENARGSRKEIVAMEGTLALVSMAEGVLPPAFPCAKTGADGSFSVGWPAPGTGDYEVLFLAPNGTVRARSRSFVPEPDRPTDLGTIGVPDAGAIAGRVVDENGRHVPDATVWCLPLDRLIVVPGAEEIRGMSRADGPFGDSARSREAVRTATDSEGGFLLDGVRPGPVRVFVRGRVAGGIVPRVLVSRGARTDLGTVVLDQPGAFVSGRVVRSGEPVGGCVVAARGAAAKTLEDGTWTLGPLAPGRCAVRVLVQGGRGLRWVDDCLVVEVEAGRHVTGQTIELPEE